MKRNEKIAARVEAAIARVKESTSAIAAKQRNDIREKIEFLHREMDLGLNLAGEDTWPYGVGAPAAHVVMRRLQMQLPTPEINEAVASLDAILAIYKECGWSSSVGPAQPLEELYDSVRVETIRTLEESSDEALDILRGLRDPAIDPDDKAAAIDAFLECCEKANSAATIAVDDPLTRQTNVFEAGNRALAAIKRMPAVIDRKLAGNAVRGFLAVYEERCDAEA